MVIGGSFISKHSTDCFLSFINEILSSVFILLYVSLLNCFNFLLFVGFMLYNLIIFLRSRLYTLLDSIFMLSPTVVA